MTIDYAIALTFPAEVAEKLSSLREEYNRYVGYTIEPHITLAYPFLPEVDIATIKEKLQAVAKRTKPFSLVLNGIEYFEEANNVAYAAVENKRPVIDLHTDIKHSLDGLIKDEYTEGIYNLERFTPHATISEQIPDEVFPIIKKALADCVLHYEIKITSFTLFSADEDGIWKPACSYQLSG